MPPYANINLATMLDGLVYADGTGIMPAAEGDLSTIIATKQTPTPVKRTSNATAVVKLTRRGDFSSVTGYVVLQTDCGDGNWIDVAWCNFSAIAPNSSLTFLLASGQFGPNSFQQSRDVGTAPSPINSSNAMGLLGRIRFVGKAAIVGSSSSSSSTPAAVSPGVLANIKVKLQGLS